VFFDWFALSNIKINQLAVQDKPAPVYELLNLYFADKIIIVLFHWLAPGGILTPRTSILPVVVAVIRAV